MVSGGNNCCVYITVSIKPFFAGVVEVARALSELCAHLTPPGVAVLDGCD